MISPLQVTIEEFFYYFVGNQNCFEAVKQNERY